MEGRRKSGFWEQSLRSFNDKSSEYRWVSALILGEKWEMYRKVVFPCPFPDDYADSDDANGHENHDVHENVDDHVDVDDPR